MAEEKTSLGLQPGSQVIFEANPNIYSVRTLDRKTRRLPDCVVNRFTYLQTLKAQNKYEVELHSKTLDKLIIAVTEDTLDKHYESKLFKFLGVIDDDINVEKRVVDDLFNSKSLSKVRDIYTLYSTFNEYINDNSKISIVATYIKGRVPDNNIIKGYLKGYQRIVTIGLSTDNRKYAVTLNLEGVKKDEKEHCVFDFVMSYKPV